MRSIFYISVVLSGLITIAGMIMVNHFTSVFDPNGYNAPDSNGNPALFFILFPMPIIAYFFYSMIFVFRTIHQQLKVKRNQFISGYTVLLFALLSFTLYRIIQFKKMAQPYFEHEIGYLNSYSNHLFFNVFTFIAALCISALLSFYLEGPKKTTLQPTK